MTTGPPGPDAVSGSHSPPLNYYCELVRRQWQGCLPAVYQQIRDPGAFFAVLGEVIAHKQADMVSPVRCSLIGWTMRSNILTSEMWSITCISTGRRLEPVSGGATTQIAAISSGRMAPVGTPKQATDEQMRTLQACKSYIDSRSASSGVSYYSPHEA